MLLKEFLKVETFFLPCHPSEIKTVTAIAESRLSSFLL